MPNLRKEATRWKSPAMVKPEHASKLNNDKTYHRRTAVRKVPSSISKIGDSFGLHTPTTLSIKRLLKKLVRTGVEWIRPPQCNRGKDSRTAGERVGASRCL